MLLPGFFGSLSSRKRGAKQTYTSSTSPGFIYRKSFRAATVFKTTFWQELHETRATKNRNTFSTSSRKRRSTHVNHIREEQKGNRHLLIHLLVLLLSRVEVDLGAGDPLASLNSRGGKKKVSAQEFVVSGGPACCWPELQQKCFIWCKNSHLTLHWTLGQSYTKCFVWSLCSSASEARNASLRGSININNHPHWLGKSSLKCVYIYI